MVVDFNSSVFILVSWRLCENNICWAQSRARRSGPSSRYTPHAWLALPDVVKNLLSHKPKQTRTNSLYVSCPTQLLRRGVCPGSFITFFVYYPFHKHKSN